MSTVDLSRTPEAKVKMSIYNGGKIYEKNPGAESRRGQTALLSPL